MPLSPKLEETEFNSGKRARIDRRNIYSPESLAIRTGYQDGWERTSFTLTIVQTEMSEGQICLLRTEHADVLGDRHLIPKQGWEWEPLSG